VMGFLRKVAARHPDQTLPGYQGTTEGVVAQVKAAYEALKSDVDLTYINSTIAFSPEDTLAVQRVRLPRESLTRGAANCIDGTVLLASILEAVSLNPAIVVVPGHAFLGWEEWEDSATWRYVETTMIASQPFEAACALADAVAKQSEEMRLKRN